MIVFWIIAWMALTLPAVAQTWVAPEPPPPWTVVQSQNQNYSPSNRSAGDIDAVVLHTAGTWRGGPETTKRLVNYFKSDNDRGVSTHFVIGWDGTIYLLLDPRHVAWHASASNSRSIGIDLAVDLGPQGASTWTPELKNSLVRLLRYLCQEYEIRRVRDLATSSESESVFSTRISGIVGHSQTSNHSDPGPGTPWSEIQRRINIPPAVALDAAGTVGVGSKRFSWAPLAMSDFDQGGSPWLDSHAITAYEVEVQRPGTSGTWQTLSSQSVAGTASSATFSIPASGSYRWRVRAINAFGAGPWAVEKFTASGTASAALAAPVLTAISGTSPGIVFEWAPVAAAAKFEVYLAYYGSTGWSTIGLVWRSDVEGGTSSLFRTQATVPWTWFTAYGHYAVWIRAVDSGGQGVFSSPEVFNLTP